MDAAKARDSLQPLAERLGATAEEAAIGIRRVVTDHMAQALKLHVTERGEDPREYAMLAFGGAAPLHAYDIANTLGLRRVIIPRRAGVLSSFGFLTAPVGLDLVRSYIQPLSALEESSLRGVFAELRARAVEALESAEVDAREATFTYALDMRYRGQGYEIQVPLADDPTDERAARMLSADALAGAFTAVYASRYGVTHDGVPEVRACRLRAEGPHPVIDAIAPVIAREGHVGTASSTRRAWFEDLNGWADVPVYQLDDVTQGQRLQGPAIIEGPHTTVVVGSRGAVTAAASGDLIVDIERRPSMALSAVDGRLDPVDLEIILARLRAIADEADYALQRTAFSSVVRDSKDYSLVIADTAGYCLALPTECMPLFVTACRAASACSSSAAFRRKRSKTGTSC